MGFWELSDVGLGQLGFAGRVSAPLDVGRSTSPSHSWCGVRRLPRHCADFWTFGQPLLLPSITSYLSPDAVKSCLETQEAYRTLLPGEAVDRQTARLGPNGIGVRVAPSKSWTSLTSDGKYLSQGTRVADYCTCSPAFYRPRASLTPRLPMCCPRPRRHGSFSARSAGTEHALHHYCTIMVVIKATIKTIRGTSFPRLVIIQGLMVFKSGQVGQMMTGGGISYHERQPARDPGQ